MIRFPSAILVGTASSHEVSIRCDENNYRHAYAHMPGQDWTDYDWALALIKGMRERGELELVKETDGITLFKKNTKT